MVILDICRTGFMEKPENKGVLAVVIGECIGKVFWMHGNKLQET